VSEQYIDECGFSSCVVYFVRNIKQPLL